MKRFVFGLGVVAALIAPPLSRDAYACSCVAVGDIGSALSQSDMVFSGLVVSADFIKARFQVDKVWKGESRSEITMLTGARDLGNGGMLSSSCDYNYRAGQRYIVYAVGAPDKLLSQACSRTAVSSLTEALGLDAVVPHRQIGDEIRACSASPADAVTREIRISTAAPTGQAVPNVTLTGESSGRKYGAFTDSLGKATFSGLQAGEYKITLSTDGYLAKQSTVNVPATGCVEASLYLLPIQKP